MKVEFTIEFKHSAKYSYVLEFAASANVRDYVKNILTQSCIVLGDFENSGIVVWESEVHCIYWKVLSE